MNAKQPCAKSLFSGEKVHCRTLYLGFLEPGLILYHSMVGVTTNIFDVAVVVCCGVCVCQLVNMYLVSCLDAVCVCQLVNLYLVSRSTLLN